MKKILVINSGWEQVDLIKEAKKMGLYVIASDADQDAPGFVLADETAVCEPRDLVGLLDLAVKRNIDAVIADQCDYSYFASAYIAEYMNLPGSGLKAAQNTTNKRWMRDNCKKAGIKQPGYIPGKTYYEVQKAAERIGYPCIVKPVDNRGNFGVNKVDEFCELKHAFYEAVSNSYSRECLVEKFIEGMMITIDGFAFGNGIHRSLAAASKTMLGGKKRVAMEIIYPAQAAPGMILELKENHNRVVSALGISKGCTHGEYILTDEGEIYLIECANRGGGCYTSSRIVPAVSGCDVNNMLIKLALSEKIAPPDEKEQMKSAVVLSFFNLWPGKILAIENEGQISADQNILGFHLAVRPGDYIKDITNDANRHGFVITRGASVQDACEKARMKKDSLVVVYE